MQFTSNYFSEYEQTAITTWLKYNYSLIALSTISSGTKFD